MPFYDFKCRTCGSVTERRTPPSARFRSCNCGGRAERLFPTSFNALNTSGSADKFAGWEMGLGTRPRSVGEVDRLMAEQGVRPAEDYRYYKVNPEDNRKEITEKELEQVLRDHNSLGTI